MSRRIGFSKLLGGGRPVVSVPESEGLVQLVALKEHRSNEYGTVLRKIGFKVRASQLEDPSLDHPEKLTCCVKSMFYT